ncbi:transcriptional regulator NagR [soil metagenome]
MVLRASPIPLYMQIEEELRGTIANGELGPLARVPSEAELSNSFGVSRMTARKALDRLVGEGLLFRQPGKGTFVATAKIQHGPSQQLSFSSAMAALGRAVSTKVLEAGVVGAPSNVAQKLGLAHQSPVVFMRRLRSVDGAPAAIHVAYLLPRFAPLLDEDLSGSLYGLMATVGSRVEHAADEIEAIAAIGDVARLLKVQPGAPLVFISGVAFSSTMEPLRFTEAVYVGDRFRFGVDGTGEPDLTIHINPAQRGLSKRD